EAQRLRCDPGSPPASLVDVDRVDDGPRELAEPIPEPHLVEGVNAARLQSVAAKGSREVRVALQQRDFHPAAGEQVGETRSRWASTNDDDSSDRHDALPSCLETSTVPMRLGLRLFLNLAQRGPMARTGARGYSTVRVRQLRSAV